MDGGQTQVVALLGAVMFVLVLGVLVLVSRCFRTPAKGTALVITGAGGTRVALERVFVAPLIHTAEALDIAVHTITIERRGREGIGRRDNIRADIRASFLVRVNHTSEDIIKVAMSVGCGRAGDTAVLQEMFAGKFIEALRTVARHLDFDDLIKDREVYKDQVLEVIGRDLNGFILDDIAIESIEQTPISQLDPNDILDAAGIRKITERTAQEQVRTNELQQRMRLEAAHESLRAEEAVMLIEQQRARAQARQ